MAWTNILAVEFNITNIILWSPCANPSPILYCLRAELQITTLSPTKDQVSVCYVCWKILDPGEIEFLCMLTIFVH